MDELPWPDEPGLSRAACYLDQLTGQRSGSLAVGSPRPSREQVKLENEAFVMGRVEDGTIRTCWFHQRNWRRISSIAIHALNRIERGEKPDWDMAARNLRTRSMPDIENVIAQARLLLSAHDSISWSPEYPELIGNGAHRICALKAQGVEATVVLVTRLTEERSAAKG